MQNSFRKTSFDLHSHTGLREMLVDELLERASLKLQRMSKTGARPHCTASVIEVLASGGAFQPLEKDVILNVVVAALHSHQDLAAR